MSLLTTLGTVWLNYLWIQSMNILPLAILLIPFTLLLIRKLPQVVFGLWIILLLRLVIPVEYGFTPITFTQSLVQQYSDEMLHLPLELVNSHPLTSDMQRVSKPWANTIPSLTLLILLGSLLKLGSVIYTRRKFSRFPLIPIIDDPINDKLKVWKQKFNIRRSIKLFRSSHPYAPHTSGFLNPRIILPQDSSVSDQHLDSILVHEMGHIIRWDDLFILLSHTITSLFFFHPLVWLAQHFLSESREMAVDQMVVSRRYLSLTDYGSALIDAAVNPYSQSLATPFSAPKAQIKKRIIALKGNQFMQARTAKLILMLTIPLLGISWISPPSTAPKPQDTGLQFISPLENVRVTSTFGKRMHPIKKKELDHGGIDLAGKTGTPVKATAAGVVSSAKFEKGWGNTIRIEHAGEYASVYAQLDKILVQPNQTIKQGDIIGQVGSSGNSTGPHLHFEIRHNNKRENPADFISF